MRASADGIGTHPVYRRVIVATLSLLPAPIRQWPSAPLARRFEGAHGKRLLWLLAVGMLAFGAAELPALVAMSSHGTSVLGFEFAGSTRRLHEILARWGSAGRDGAEQHVLIDLGFIVCYGLLLGGACGRLSGRFARGGRRTAAGFAALLGWAGLVAAAVNALEKVFLWFELHGHAAQPLPAFAFACGVITSTLGVSAALFAISGNVAADRSRLPAPRL